MLVVLTMFSGRMMLKDWKCFFAMFSGKMMLGDVKGY